MADNREYFRPENAWKSVKVNGRQAWRAVLRGHELWAQARNYYKNVYDWWITSDKDGRVITARGSQEALMDAQRAAIDEARRLAPGALSTQAFLPSELKAIRDGTMAKLNGGSADGTKAVGRLRRRPKNGAGDTDGD